MALYVNTNVSSLNGQRYLSNVQTSLNTTYQRLSSGLRINSAKDDAAGLQIADRMTTQINGLTQGNRNSSDAIALAQTIEGGLDEITTMLQSVRTLAVQAANGTNTEDDRKSLTQQANAYASEINRIARQTKFGGKTVLAGADAKGATTITSIYGAATADGALKETDGTIKFQVGANSGDAITLTVNSFTLSKILSNAKFAAGAAPADNVDASTTGGITLVKVGDAYLSDQLKPANGATGGWTDNGAKASMRFALSTASAASALIKTLDLMINQVDTQRGSLGAIQNRLESTIRNQSNVAANQTDARSRIRDADFAQESANLSQQSIIQQAASSMLTQANMRPQLALSLLG